MGTLMKTPGPPHLRLSLTILSQEKNYFVTNTLQLSQNWMEILASGRSELKNNEKQRRV